MKKKDILLAAGICLFAVLIWLFTQFFFPKDNQKIRITVDGEPYGEYVLAEDQKISIGETNICQIQNGKVRMIQANCPDQLCVHQKAVDGAGGTIVCLPNQVVIEAVAVDGAAVDNLDIDAVA